MEKKWRLNLKISKSSVRVILVAIEWLLEFFLKECMQREERKVYL